MSLFEKYHFDKVDNKLHIERTQDVEPILESNKRAYNETGRGGFKSEIFNKKAEIPLTILLQWCKSRGVTYNEWMRDPKLQKAFLNDPDNKFCLTRPGKV